MFHRHIIRCTTTLMVFAALCASALACPEPCVGTGRSTMPRVERSTASCGCSAKAEPRACCCRAEEIPGPATALPQDHVPAAKALSWTDAGMWYQCVSPPGHELAFEHSMCTAVTTRALLAWLCTWQI